MARPLTQLMHVNLEPPPERALAIAAHPDDAEFGCGATLAKWAAGGCVVHLLVLTDGSKGSWDPDDDVDALVATRKDEQRAAALALGVKGEVAFLDNVDGELKPTLDVQRAIAWWIRTVKPDVVLGHDPWRRYRLHPDHRNAGWATVDAVVAARDPHFFRDLELGAHRPGALLLFEADEPDLLEDVTGHTDAKLAALEQHRSQYRSTHGIDDPDAAEQVERFRRRVVDHLARVGAEHGLTHAEAFKRLDPSR